MNSLLSLEFFAFLLLFLPIYWTFYGRLWVQNTLLWGAGLLVLWLMAGIYPLLVLLGTSAITLFGIAIITRTKHKLAWFWVFAIFLILQLMLYKYTELPAGIWQIGVPLGLSYYTFMALGLLDDCRRGLNTPWLKTLTQLNFFATITAGPITRAHDVSELRDIFGKSSAFYRQVPRQIYLAPALLLIAMGLIKKWWLSAVLAQNWVSPVFADPSAYPTSTIITAIYGYTAELFLDFSGYSDLAIGVALLLGIRLPVNFNAPLSATNLRDFWARWHITLSSFIKRMIYIPLGGNRHGMIRTQIHVFLAMVLSGLWHGNSANFLVWGALHGIGVIIYHAWASTKLRLPKLIGGLITLSFVCFSFVFFRATNINDAFSVLNAAYLGLFTPDFIAKNTDGFIFLTIGAVLLLIYAKTQRLWGQYLRAPKYGFWVAVLLIIIATVASPDGIPEFIYASF